MDAETNKKIRLLDLDWESLATLMKSYDSKEGVWYMITYNKGMPDEYRTRFMPYQEALDMILYALEKKRLRVKE